jgi:16S rRNA G966 N2-methylase RsmD
MIFGTALDGFSGCGGNTISLAKQFEKVIAVDLDPVKISFCHHNAGIYGVEEKIHLMCEDIYKVFAILQANIDQTVDTIIPIDDMANTLEHMDSDHFIAETVEPNVENIDSENTCLLINHMTNTVSKKQSMYEILNHSNLEIYTTIRVTRSNDGSSCVSEMTHSHIEASNDYIHNDINQSEIWCMGGATSK